MVVTAAMGSSPLTWKIGAPTILATAVQYLLEAAVDGRGGEADLVVDDDVDGAAGAIAFELRKIERFRHHALAGERGVAVDEHGQHLAALLRCR